MTKKRGTTTIPFDYFTSMAMKRFLVAQGAMVISLNHHFAQMLHPAFSGFTTMAQKIPSLGLNGRKADIWI